MADSFDPYYRWLGIPPEYQPPDHYRLLGIVRFESEAEVIANAADARMSHLRVFQAGKHSKLSQKLLNEVAAAKICLLTPERKAAYDVQLAAGGPQAATAPSGPAVPQGEVRSAPPPLPGPRPMPQPAASAAPQPAAAAPASRSAPMPAVVVATDQPAVVVRDAPVAARRASGPSSTRNLALTIVSIGVSLVLVLIGAMVLSSQLGQKQSTAALDADRDEESSWDADLSGGTPLDDATARQDTNDRDGASRENENPGADGTDTPGRDESPAGDRGAESEGTEAPMDSREPEPGDEKPEGQPGPGPKGDEERRPSENVNTRAPRPPESELETARRLVDEQFQLAGSRAPSESIALADRLYRAAREEGMPPAEKYALLERAADQAIEGGDARRVMAAVEALGRAFEIDAPAARHTALWRFAERADDSVRREGFVEQSLALIDELTDRGDYEEARALASKALELCRQTPPVALRGAAEDQSAWLAEALRRRAEREAAEPTLADSPDDARAHLAAGIWRCFFRDDWDGGAVHLSKGGDEGLRQLASLEIDRPADADGRAGLADRWWELAESAEEPQRAWYRRRAAQWYLRALPDATGLTQAKMLKRLGDAAAGLKRTARDARLAVQIHEALLSDSTIGAEQRAAIQEQLAAWSRLAAPPDHTWSPGTEAASAGAPGAPEVEELLRSAASLIAARSHEAARDKLTEAIRQDPEDIRASLTIGLIDALREGDFDAAENRFNGCLRKRPEDVASLNNRALTEVRMKQLRRAVRDWEKAVEQAPECPEVLHNLRRCKYLHERNVLALDAATLKAIDEVTARADASRFSFNSGVHWKYMAAKASASGVTGWPGSESLEDRACVVCNGLGHVDCPNRNCRKGSVRVMQTRVVGRNPVTGAKITETVPVPVPCRTCRGQGRVPCKACVRGEGRY